MQEKLFLIVINIQKNQTICFQITGMPSLSFFIINALGGWWGEPSGRAERRGEHNELVQDDSGSLAADFSNKQRAEIDAALFTTRPQI